MAGWWGVALTLSAGWTNLGYVLAMLGGEVMRVLLLFYLAPLWTVLLSHLLLGERLNRYGYTIIALSLGGAFVMLWRPHHGLPLPQNLAEWIGLSAGCAFALTNVLVRRVQHLSINFKSASVWFGTALLTLLALLYHGNVAAQVQAITPEAWWLMAARRAGAVRHQLSPCNTASPACPPTRPSCCSCSSWWWLRSPRISWRARRWARGNWPGRC